MGISLPALSIRPPEQQAGPLEQFGKVLQLKSLLAQQQSIPVQQQIQQQQLQQEQLQTQSAQQDIKDRQALADAYKKFDPSKPEELPKLISEAGGSGKVVGPAIAQVFELKQKAAAAFKDQQQGNSAAFDALHKQADLFAGHIESLKGLSDEQLPGAILPTVQTAIQQGLVPQEQSAQILQQGQQIAQLPPAQIRQALTVMEKSAQGQKAILDQTAKQQEMATQLATQQHVQGEEQRAQQMQPLNVQEKKANITEKYAQANKAGLEAKLAQGGLDQAAIDQAAEKYFSTGQLPTNMGRGNAGAATARQIMNRAAELHPQGNLAANSAEYAANKHSLENIQKNYDQVTAFEGTAGKNLDQFLATAKKVIDTGSPFLNTPVRMVSDRMVGSENQAAFNAARTTALTEIAKVLNSSNANGVLSDSARHEVEALTGSGATLKQIYSAANILRQDMENRRVTYQQQIDDIKGRLGGKSQTQGAGQAQPGGFSWDSFPKHQ